MGVEIETTVNRESVALLAIGLAIAGVVIVLVAKIAK